MAERRRKPAPATVDNLDSLYADDVDNVTATDLAEADTLAQIAIAVLRGRTDTIAQLPEGAERIGQDLVLAFGRGVDLSTTDPTERLAALGRAEHRLARPMAILAGHPGGNALIVELAERLAVTRAALFRYQQRGRVDAAVTIGDAVVEPTGDGAQVIEAHALYLQLVELGKAIGVPVVDAALTAHFEGTAPVDAATAATYVKYGLELIKQKTALVIDLLGSSADEAKRFGVAAELVRARTLLGGTIGTLSSALTIVTGVATALDPDASTRARIEGAIGAVGGAVGLTGTVLETASMLGNGVTAGVSTVGTTLAAVGSGIGLALLEWKVISMIITDGWGARMGLTKASLGHKIGVMTRAGDRVAEEADHLHRASELAAHEPDAARAAELRVYQRELAAKLGRSIDSFIAEFRDPPPGELKRDWSLCIDQLVEVFHPLFIFKGTRDPEKLLAATHVMLDRIAFVIRNVDAIAFAMTTGDAVAPHVTPE